MKPDTRFRMMNGLQKALLLLLFAVGSHSLQVQAQTVPTIHVDATALTPPEFGIVGAGLWATADSIDIALESGSYTFRTPGGPSAGEFDFTVGADGTLDYATALDGFVSGRGTQTLTVTGLAVTFDLTAVNAQRFQIDGGRVGTFDNQITTIRILPGQYGLQAPASGAPESILFTLLADGFLNYGPALDGYVGPVPWAQWRAGMHLVAERRWS